MTRPLVLLVTILGKPRPDVSVLQYHVSPDLVGLRPEPGPSSYSDSATLAVSFITSSPDFVGHLCRASSRPALFALRASFLADCWDFAPTLLATQKSETYGGFAPTLPMIDSLAQCCDVVRRFVLTSNQPCLWGFALSPRGQAAISYSLTWSSRHHAW